LCRGSVEQDALRDMGRAPGANLIIGRHNTVSCPPRLADAPGTMQLEMASHHPPCPTCGLPFCRRAVLAQMLPMWPSRPRGRTQLVQREGTGNGTKPRRAGPHTVCTSRRLPRSGTPQRTPWSSTAHPAESTPARGRSWSAGRWRRRRRAGTRPGEVLLIGGGGQPEHAPIAPTCTAAEAAENVSRSRASFASRSSRSAQTLLVSRATPLVLSLLPSGYPAGY